jgi:hypothetical protein
MAGILSKTEQQAKTKPTSQSDRTLALTPAQGVSVFRRDFVRSPGEREKLSSASDDITIE